MVAAGLAAVLEPSQVTADSVAALANTALGDQRPAVDAVRAEIAAMPHPASVIESLIERLGSSIPPRRQPRLVSQAG